MDQIISISVKHVKGIENKTFNVEIFPNKLAVFVAPNGFGKSSLATAFGSLKRTGIHLADDQFYEEDPTNHPELRISYKSGGQTHTVEATSTKNQLEPVVSADVITCSITPKGTVLNQAAYPTASAKIVVPDVVLFQSIPKSTFFSYKLSEMKTKFGAGGKALPKITDLLTDPQLVQALWSSKTSWNSPLLVKATVLNNTHTTFLKEHTGTKGEILHDGDLHWVKQLAGIKQYAALVEILKNVRGASEISYACWLSAIQIYLIYHQDKDAFKQATQSLLYKKRKKFCADLLKEMGTGWQKVQLKEEGYGGKERRKKRLVVKFPKLNAISNGQRDILIFIANILKFETTASSCNSILIIDEVFDYLDDANLLAVQYYVTKLIDEYKRTGRKIFPIILTHLNPDYFKTFAFNSRKMKVCFLKQQAGGVDQHLIKLMQLREDRSVAEELRNDISRCLFHYHLDEMDRREDFKNLRLKELWGEGRNFDTYIGEQMQKYLSADSYEPFAVCCSLRKCIEKKCYEMLDNDDLKEKYLTEHTTKKKMDVAVSEGGACIPETYYLLSSLYNDSLHWKKDRDMITPLVCKLENLTIRKMISEVMNNS